MKKKRIPFVILFLCVFNNSFAQVKHSFPNKDAEWTILSWCPEPEFNYTFKSVVLKDTVINNKIYSIIGDKVGGGSRCALRSDSLKVYARNIFENMSTDNVPVDTNEYVLYDYGLIEGERFKVPNYNENLMWLEQPDTMEFTVLKVDSIKIGRDYRRRLELSASCLNHQYWIDGIGSSISPIYQAYMTEFESGYDLECYRENGERVFGRNCEPDFIQIPFPNKGGEWFIKSYNESNQIWVYHQNPDRIEKDTMINSQTYSILKSGTFGYRCAIRNDYPRYYYIDLSHPERGENILYDFSLEKGETIKLVHFNDNGQIDTIQWYVDQVYYSEWGGNSKDLFLKNSYKDGLYPSIYWREGVGSSSGPMYPLRPSIIGNLHEFYCYKEDGYPTVGDCSKVSVQKPLRLDFRCSFLCTQNILLVEGQFEEFDLMIVDTSGRLVVKRLNCCDNQIDLSSLKKGVYICLFTVDHNSISKKIAIR